MKSYSFSSKHLTVVEEALPEFLFTDIENIIFSNLRQYGETSDLTNLLTLIENDVDTAPELTQILLKALLVLRDDDLRLQICTFLQSSEERFEFFIQFFIELNSFLETMVADLFEDAAKRLTVQKIEQLHYYDILHPIVSLEDKYIAYIFLTEFGKSILPFIINGLKTYHNQLFDIISYFVDTITLEYEDRLLTDLYQELLDNLINYVAANRFSSREFAETYSILTEYIVDLLNSKIWLFLFNLDDKYINTEKRSKLEEVATDPQLSRNIAEVFLAPIHVFHNKFFTYHAHLMWTDFYAADSEGTIPFLTRKFFELWNFGTSFPEFYFEELYKLLKIDALDIIKYRSFLLRNIIYREHSLIFAERGMLREVYEQESYKIQLLDDEEFLEYMDLTVENTSESVIFFELLDSLEYDDFEI